MFGRKATIRKYLDKLPSELKKRYGKPAPYSVGQVESTINDLNLSKKYIEYAYLVFCERKALSGFGINEQKYDKMLVVAKVAAGPSIFGVVTGSYTGGSDSSGSGSEFGGSGDGGGGDG